MNIPVTLLTWSTAALPVLILLVLMVGFQMPAKRAAVVGLAAACAGAFAVYRAGIPHILMELGKGAWSSLSILIVVWPAIFLYESVNEAGAFAVFKSSLERVTKNELLRVILAGWVFTSFLQGITGFGVPVAVGAPLLMSIGMKPFWAVVIPLLAHTWGNTFGTLGAAWDALVLQAGLTGQPGLLHETALWTGIFLWGWNFLSGLLLCWFYGRGEGVRRGFAAASLISLSQGGGQLLMGQWNTTLSCFVPCCVSAGVVILLGKTPWYADSWAAKDSLLMESSASGAEGREEQANMSAAQAFFPYILLTAITLAVLLVGPVKNLLGRFRVGFAFPGMSTGYGFEDAAVESFSPLAPFTHAGMFLLVSAILGFWYFKSRGFIGEGGGREAFSRTVKKTVPSSVSVICFIAMSRVMSGTGQTVVLAQGIAGALGNFYVILAPLIGLLGSFMTSSNMASNILFGDFQMTTARLLEMDPAPILGAQTAGGAIGSAICPGNIVLGTTAAGIGGKEGLVLRRLLPVVAAAAAAVGLVLYGVLM